MFLLGKKRNGKSVAMNVGQSLLYKADPTIWIKWKVAEEYINVEIRDFEY